MPSSPYVDFALLSSDLRRHRLPAGRFPSEKTLLARGEHELVGGLKIHGGLGRVKRLLQLIEQQKAERRKGVRPSLEELLSAVAGHTPSVEAVLKKTNKLVYSIAKQTLIKRPEDYSQENLEDLVSEGKLQMVLKIPSYAPEEADFSTFIVPWLKSSMNRHLKSLDPFAVPEKTRIELAQIGRAFSSMHAELGRVPTDEEVRRRLGWRPKKFNELIKHRRSVSLPVSLDEPVEEDNPKTLLEVIRSPEVDYLSFSHLMEIREALRAEMRACLTPREEKALVLRFGLFGNEEMSLKQVGRELRVTRQRIKQIEKLALKKLKRSPRLSRLFE